MISLLDLSMPNSLARTQLKSFPRTRMNAKAFSVRSKQPTYSSPHLRSSIRL